MEPVPEPTAGPPPPPLRWARAAAVAAAALLLFTALGLALDLDRDGQAALRELRGGTSPWDGDSDGDGLGDGWEARHGLRPLASDGDGDGLGDGSEVDHGADPGRRDSDQDGLPDAREMGLRDCDGDGLPAVAEGDGDSDGRLDALEPAAARCEADVDGDGVLDGSEGNADCVARTDCDRDGVADGDETGAFDPLDPDSFGSGVSDAVSLAFQASGQPPGADGDGDGIPDGWEGSTGLVQWGDLQPQPGRRDLLVEFLRVDGPDSGRYSSHSFTAAYEAVAAAAQRERGVAVRWTETVVHRDSEPAPPLLPTIGDSYYAGVLEAGRHSRNPYVTTVVLNPQHDQSQQLHSGVAPIRGMLAAVDYGAHMAFTFAGENRSVTLSPRNRSSSAAARTCWRRWDTRPARRPAARSACRRSTARRPSCGAQPGSARRRASSTTTASSRC
jgi:hypothetical protein